MNESASFLRDNFEEQLKFLNHSKFGPPAKQLLLTESLLAKHYRRDLSAIADCLLADSPAVRRDAAARLERLIIVTSPK